MNYQEEMDYTEISDVLRMPMGTVASRLSRAKKIFKDKYEKKLNNQK